MRDGGGGGGDTQTGGDAPKGLAGQDSPNQGNQHLVLPPTAARSGKTASPCCLSSGQGQGDGDLSWHHTLLGNPQGWDGDNKPLLYLIAIISY